MSAYEDFVGDLERENVNLRHRVGELEARVAELESQNASLRERLFFRETPPSVSGVPIDFGPGPHPRLDCCNGHPAFDRVCSRGTKGCNLPHADAPRPSEAVPSKASLDVARSFIAGLMLAGTQFESSTIKIAANLARVIDGAVNAARPETARRGTYEGPRFKVERPRTGRVRIISFGSAESGKDEQIEVDEKALLAALTGSEE